METSSVIILGFCFLAGLCIVSATTLALMHKKIYDENRNEINNEIEIPLMGKIKTNTPTVLLFFIGLTFGFFGWDSLKNKTAELVEFNGELIVKPEIQGGLGAIYVGVTSGAWTDTRTHDGQDGAINVRISVPDSWNSYTAYALPLGESNIRPEIVGTSLTDPTFKIELKQ